LLATGTLSGKKLHHFISALTLSKRLFSSMSLQCFVKCRVYARIRYQHHAGLNVIIIVSNV